MDPSKLGPILLLARSAVNTTSKTGNFQSCCKTHTALNDTFMGAIQGRQPWSKHLWHSEKRSMLITHQSSMTISGWKSSSSSSHRPSAFRSTICSVENQLWTWQEDTRELRLMMTDHLWKYIWINIKNIQSVRDSNLYLGSWHTTAPFGMWLES